MTYPFGNPVTVSIWTPGVEAVDETTGNVVRGDWTEVVCDEAQFADNGPAYQAGAVVVSTHSALLPSDAVVTEECRIEFAGEMYEVVEPPAVCRLFSPADPFLLVALRRASDLKHATLGGT